MLGCGEGVVWAMAKNKGVFLGDLPSNRNLPKAPENCGEIFKIVFFSPYQTRVSEE